MRQVLGAVPLSEEGLAAANAALDRADQERKKGVPMHLRKNAAQVRGRCLTRIQPRPCPPVLKLRLLASVCAPPDLRIKQLRRLSRHNVHGPLEKLLMCTNPRLVITCP